MYVEPVLTLLNEKSNKRLFKRAFGKLRVSIPTGGRDEVELLQETLAQKSLRVLKMVRSSKSYRILTVMRCCARGLSKKIPPDKNVSDVIAESCTPHTAKVTYE